MIENNREVKKSRDLTVLQLFEILQEEYIVCELRAKIYPLDFLKLFWSNLAEKKKEKIVHIAQRNSLFSIFDSVKIRQDYYERIIPQIGFPNFIYKDDMQRLKQEKWDIHNYYLPDSEVTVYINGELLKGIIDRVIFPDNTGYVKIKNIVKPFDLSLITRIL